MGPAIEGTAAFLVLATALAPEGLAATVLESLIIAGGNMVFKEGITGAIPGITSMMFPDSNGEKFFGSSYDISAALARPLDPVCRRRVRGGFNCKFDERYRSNRL